MQVDSPYNTYRYTGLPPGPIASPGRASIDAALHPAPADALYFVSRNDGTHVFSKTYEEPRGTWRSSRGDGEREAERRTPRARPAWNAPDAERR